MNNIAIALLAVGVALALTACVSTKAPNQPLAASVDVDRFMGTWYVHGHTMTALDKKAYAATETYEMDAKGKIRTTYRFRNGSFDGKEKVYRPVGWVHDETTGAEWRMRFFGVYTAPYYILYVDSEYEYTVIGHPGKELAWIMSRSPVIEESQYDELMKELTNRGYDLKEFRRLPQKSEV